MRWPLDQIESNGFAVVSDAVDPPLVQSLLAALSAFPEDPSTRKRSGKPFARRNLLTEPAVQSLCADPRIRALFEPLLGRSARPVRAILFDKTPDANWVVPWHQDLSIAVSARMDIPGFEPWSVKSGIPHVQPPLEVLQGMLTLRLHLDPCGEDNGPLRVIPGSHHSVLSPEAISRCFEEGRQVACTCPSGGALLMRPLILHASSPAKAPSHRRVIHIEFAAADLRAGLCWFADAGGK